MNIVYSIPSPIGGGGLGVDSLETLKGIHARGYLKKVVAYGNRQKDIPGNLIKRLGVNPSKIFSNLPARYYYPIKMKALDRLTVRVLKQGADLFHGWAGSSLKSLTYNRSKGIVSILEHPAPHVRYIDRIISEEYGELGIRWKKGPEVFKKFFGIDEAYLASEYDLATYILLESEFTRDTFRQRGVPDDKLLCIPRGVDVDRFVPPRERGKEVFRVVFVGNVGVRKGIRYLLEAWTELRLKRAELLIVGGIQDNVRRLVETFVKTDPTIRMSGHVEDPVRMYQMSSVFALPSLSEGSAKVTYEAMACGLPVIVTPNAGSVAVDGEHGFIVPVREREPLRDKILLLYENPGLREEMGRKARKHIESYSWDRFREKMIDTYENAALSRSSHGSAMAAPLPPG